MTTNFAAGSGIRNQDKVIHRLTGFFQSGNIPHALLFTGNDGVGKKKTALAFAGALNCRTIAGHGSLQGASLEPCGTCRPCKKIAAGHHPDVVVLEPVQSQIKIAAVRNLTAALAVKPYEALKRVVVIHRAQALNPQAANALLKLLEEPPADTILILIAVNTYSLLPTIVSRCQQISFKPIPDRTLAAYLEQKGILPEKAAILGKLAGGSFAKADSLAETDWLSRREWIIQLMERLDDDRMCSHWAALSMAFSEVLSRDRETVNDVLELMTTWFRDTVVVNGGSENVINHDMLPRLRMAAQRLSPKTVLSRIDHLETARKKLDANANLRLTIDIMLMNLFPGPAG